MAPNKVKRKEQVFNAKCKQPKDLFRKDTCHQRYEDIKNWTFIPKRQVGLKKGEYCDFANELTKRK